MGWQRYNRVLVMNGHSNKVQSIIRHIFSRVLYIHCNVYSLNLEISNASKITSIEIKIKMFALFSDSVQIVMVIRYYKRNFYENIEFKDNVNFNE